MAGRFSVNCKEPRTHEGLLLLRNIKWAKGGDSLQMWEELLPFSAQSNTSRKEPARAEQKDLVSSQEPRLPALAVCVSGKLLSAFVPVCQMAVIMCPLPGMCLFVCFGVTGLGCPRPPRPRRAQPLHPVPLSHPRVSWAAMPTDQPGLTGQWVDAPGELVLPPRPALELAAKHVAVVLLLRLRLPGWCRARGRLRGLLRGSCGMTPVTPDPALRLRQRMQREVSQRQTPHWG